MLTKNERIELLKNVVRDDRETVGVRTIAMELLCMLKGDLEPSPTVPEEKL